MKPLTCAAARRRLCALHDGELSIEEQIAMEAHLDWCEDCAEVLSDLRLVGATLRATGHAREALSFDEAFGLNATVVQRVKAEREGSWLARMRVAFDDMHLVYAGLGATVAALGCVIIVIGMLRMAGSVRPNSLAAMVNVLASRGSDQNPVSLDRLVSMPRALDTSFSAVPYPAGEDVEFLLAAVVTRDGRVANLQLLPNSGEAEVGRNRAKAVEGLLSAVSRARFEPAQQAGLPVAVNMVWLVAHTTVRGTKPGMGLRVSPVVRKRIA